MHKLVVSLIAAVGAVLAAGIAPAPVTAAPFSASAVMPQDAAMASDTVTLAGVRYWYGYRPYYRYYGYYYPYYPYYDPLTICGTMRCYQPRYRIVAPGFGFGFDWGNNSRKPDPFRQSKVGTPRD